MQLLFLIGIFGILASANAQESSFANAAQPLSSEQASSSIHASLSSITSSSSSHAPVSSSEVASSSSLASSSSTLKGMVQIPQGCFTMGSTDGNWDEKPAHQACVSAFWMDRTEVTQADYAKATGHNPAWFKANSCFSWNRCVGDCPVESVSWFDAKSYCESEGKRLPTEAEWEYAARGGTNTKYFCGNGKQCLEAYAWFGKNSEGKPHPVGQKKPNGYGLYDILGNVSEWVADYYDETYYFHAPLQNPRGAFNGAVRVLRGADYSSPAFALHSAFRAQLAPVQKDALVGFRCAGDHP